MKLGRVLIPGIAAAALVVVVSAPVALALPCPEHFDPAQNAIDKATAAMKALPEEEKMRQVHTLIDDAKMLLASAKHHCAAGSYDHARSAGKADAARGYAKAAEDLAKKYTERLAGIPQIAPPGGIVRLTWRELAPNGSLMCSS